jgi:tetratricopeptide (TPR) repeat protein
LSNEEEAKNVFSAGLTARQELFSISSDPDDQGRAHVQSVHTSDIEQDGDLRLISEAYSRALELFPAFAEAYLERGIVSLVTGKVGESRDDFRQCFAYMSELSTKQISLILSFFEGDELRFLANLAMDNLTEMQKKDTVSLVCIWYALAMSYYTESRYNDYLLEMERMLALPHLRELIENSEIGIGILSPMATAFHIVGEQSRAGDVLNRVGRLILQYRTE